MKEESILGTAAPKSTALSNNGASSLVSSKDAGRLGITIFSAMATPKLRIPVSANENVAFKSLDSIPSVCIACAKFCSGTIVPSIIPWKKSLGLISCATDCATI